VGEPAAITDEYMREMLGQTRGYVVVLLKTGPAYGTPGTDAVIWEHGRRNFALRAEGVLSIVCPVADDSDLAGVSIFEASVDVATQLMEQDPAVQAEVLTYEAHPVRSFPGDCLRPSH
jgi:hypothetical protein